ncbi:DUF4396 domain-containing protein [Nitrospira sp. Nam80]
MNYGAQAAHHRHHSPHSHQTVVPSLNRLAVAATLHCLTGCAIGEVLGLVIAMSLGWGNAGSITLAVLLAFVFGYAFTLIPLISGGMTFAGAASIAVAADTVSIIVMEIMDNAMMLAIPGAMDAGVTDGLFWSSLALSFIAAFVVTVPVNRWLIARGRGHAVVHAHH